MKSLLRAVLISSLSALTLRAQLHGQTSAGTDRPPIQPEAGTYQVAGIIVNANSGAPLDRVDVTITSTGRNKTKP